MSAYQIAQWLNDTQIGVAVRESVYAFPIIEGAHLIGLALSLGLIFFVDLRLTGLFLNTTPVSHILHSLRRWLILGFALTLSTGVILFLSEATKLIDLPVFWIKVALIALAGLNALWFELKWGRYSEQWQQLSRLPGGVRLAGWASLALWFGVLSCGRLIPYLGTGL